MLKWDVVVLGSYKQYVSAGQLLFAECGDGEFGLRIPAGRWKLVEDFDGAFRFTLTATVMTALWCMMIH